MIQNTRQCRDNRLALLAVLAACGTFALGGCVPTVADGLLPGTYAGELACQATVTNPEGVEATEDFTFPMTLIVAADGNLTVNSEPITVGLEVTRSLPNSDLAFEVLTISASAGQVTVTYDPRPTLPGITVTGDLTEDYTRAEAGVAVSGQADLVVTDISGDSTFDITCTGALPPQ